MMGSYTSKTIIYLLWYLCAIIILYSGSSHANMNVGCNERDRETLEIFKRSIEDPSKLLSSWSTEEDCCHWFGVHCDNLTRRVTKLDLSRNYSSGKRFGGQINLYVLKLEFLTFLDLHYNDFNAIYVPPIHNSSMISTIHHGANFSNLVYLDLSYNSRLKIYDLRWVSQLSSLEYIDLSYADLSEETLWLQRVNMLHSLRELRLSNCSLKSLHLESHHFSDYFHEISNFFISVVDLSMNALSGSIPPELFMSNQLKALNLSHNALTGSIPNEIGYTEHLESLDLSKNQLVGQIPQSMVNLKFLLVLNLSYNNLRGEIPGANRFSTFGPSSFLGNPELYRFQLTEDNPEGVIPNEEKEIIEGSDDNFSKCFKMGMAIGFAYSFWGVCLSLFFINPWRNADFRFLSNMYDRIYVFIALKKKWLRRHLTGYDICFQMST